ncbi:MAG: hypothetical protein F6J93_09685 [Oscillatoria sp. SIO1A7]|nr:hypothetical protein [Oscillatoria sp. SIO1A7]
MAIPEKPIETRFFGKTGFLFLAFRDTRETRFLEKPGFWLFLALVRIIYYLGLGDRT